ncbi:hypothetical protein ACTQ5B_08245, partial [Bifidobacterium pseudolongum]|uniref:hypothetical protein n=1 Tax=Bifidobacterium pseudolongum TaxID=1694 RepID=UPI003F913E3D
LEGWLGILILERASRLDAFSGYPSRTWPTSHAAGATTCNIRLFLVQNSFSSLILILSMIFRNSQQ